MNIVSRIVLVSSFALVGGCIVRTPTHGGPTIDAAWVQSIQKGVTTMDEVRARMGTPSSMTQSPDYETWTYTHWEGKPAILGEGYQSYKTQSLVVRFKSGKVADYSLSSTGS